MPSPLAKVELDEVSGYNEFMIRATDSPPELLLEGLNEPQREAVAHTDGPLLILAGPGSGKTRVVTRRAAYLACTVTDPWHILAITFTNKAATEMRERVDALGVGHGMTVGTFHALCARLLRQYHDRAGVPRNFTVFDRDDRRKLIKQAIDACQLSTDNWSPARIDSDIGRAKNAMLGPDAYAQQADRWREQTIARIYEAYERLLRDMGGLDFDDLLLRLALLLEEDSDLRVQLEERFRYVLVDEYQDTNAAQYRIARNLTRQHNNLCATGDPDQSIYGWRGANIDNILNFERDFPDAKVVCLEQNYRSTKRILSAADALIAGNVQRKEKTLWADNDDGECVRVMESDDGQAEAEWIANDINTRRRAGADLADMAIFYRINSLSRAVEEALLIAGIPYQIARGVEFYNRKEIKDVLAYIRVLVNPSDEIALVRVINMPTRGIGATTIKRLKEMADRAGQSIHDLIVADDLSELRRSAAKVRQFAALLDTLRPALDQPAPDALEFVISHSGLRAHYDAEFQADDGPINNLNELVSAASEFQDLQPDATILDWLEHTALMSDVDSVRSESGTVTLMTLHAAKGLEFPSVYIVGLEQGLLPFQRDQETCDEEEERRLLFVGMTRAKERLVLSWARYRTLRGMTLRTTASRFLDELPQDGVEWDRVATPSSKGPRAAAGRLPDDFESWTVGTLVRHRLHGLGTVLTIERGAKRTHVDIRFQDGSRRSWVLEFADLVRVDFDDVGDVENVVGA